MKRIEKFSDLPDIQNLIGKTLIIEYGNVFEYFLIINFAHMTKPKETLYLCFNYKNHTGTLVEVKIFIKESEIDISFQPEVNNFIVRDVYSSTSSNAKIFLI